jgi:hypothetical protein
MNDKGPLLPQQHRVPKLRAGDGLPDDGRTVATQDPEVIQGWARRRHAIPATGERSVSGPAVTVNVQDGGTGIRFNFPGVSPFREVSWEEWLDHFRQHQLTMVFEERTEDGTLSNRYRLVREEEWDGQF